MEVYGSMSSHEFFTEGSKGSEDESARRLSPNPFAIFASFCSNLLFEVHAAKGMLYDPPFGTHRFLLFEFLHAAPGDASVGMRVADSVPATSVSQHECGEVFGHRCDGEKLRS
jgi:hypothetical protein